ncbi:MAG TPA: PD-(D/E)XK nuclease family protein, partial [Polyangiaceae bacterium]
HLKVHDDDGSHQLRLDLRPVEAKTAALAAAQREALAEHLRLAYVALTRAKHRTVVVWGAFGHAENSPLGYLLYQAAGELGALSETPAGRVAKMTDSELLRGLAELEKSSEGAISVRPLEPEPAPPYLKEAAEVERFAARPLTRVIDRSQRTTSFSQLTQHHARETLVASLGKDVDDVLPQIPPNSAEPLGEPVALAEFPKGARTGELLHAILEHADFTSPASLEAQVTVELQRYGLAADEWSNMVLSALSNVLATRLSSTSELELSKLTPRQRVSEMEFTLPLGAQRGSRARGALLSAARLASVFEHHAPELGSAYLERVKSMGFSPLSGFMRGFIDLVFEYDGRFFVVDYKSNHLGAHASDYAPALLRAPMAEHHYYLQYHLYVTALHRHLGARRPGYDYDRDFGGVYYLFLRGMAPQHPSGSGVFFDRPARGLIEALSALFEAEPEAETRAAAASNTAASSETMSFTPGGLA